MICADHIHKYTYMWGACERHVRGMWGTCEVHVRGMWGACEGHVRYMWGACEGHVRCMWGGTCEVQGHTQQSQSLHRYLLQKPTLSYYLLQKRGFWLKFMLKNLKAGTTSVVVLAPRHVRVSWCWYHDAGTTSVVSVMSVTGKTIFSLVKFYFWR